VSRIAVTETLTQQQVEQQLSSNSPGADMGWDSPIPTASVPAFLAAKNPRLTLGASYASDPYLLFDLVSPNNGGALDNRTVRQAMEYSINRSDLVRATGGPQVSPVLTHVLPPGVLGSQPADPYPYDPEKAKQMLRSARAPSLHLKVLYQEDLDFEVRMFQILQSDLAKVGITVTGVATNSSDFYTKYLEVPSVAKSGAWDLALAQWVPDWYGNAAYSFLYPLFAGPVSFPPEGSNFGFYNSPETNKLIRRASTTRSLSTAESLWAQADRQVMADAAIFPITTPAVPVYHAIQVHNAVFVPNLFQFDPTNVWLTPSRNGG
jgi:peptide/nickel transport system substrate-binding protein